jgi:hypothetical protein
MTSLLAVVAAAFVATAAPASVPLTSAAPAPASLEAVPTPTLPSTFQGRFGLDMRVTTLTWVPLYGDVVSVTSTRGFMDIAEENGELVATQHVCDVRISGDAPFGVRADIPPSFVKALRVKRFPLKLVPGRALAFVADTGVENIGFDGAKTGGLLPKKANDPAITDADRDGRPGTTVSVTLPFGRFLLSVVSIGQSKLIGTIVDDTKATGFVRILRQEQRVIASDLPFVPDDIGAAKEDPARSTFQLRRMDAAGGCGALDGLFGPVKPWSREG